MANLRREEEAALTSRGAVSFETQKNQEDDQEEDEETMKTLSKNLQQETVVPISKITKESITYFDYQIYNFTNLKTDFLNNTIKINEYISCLPNILSISSYCT